MKKENISKIIKQNSFGKESDYIVLRELPSKFRSYDFDEIYVRGLYFGEAISFAKYGEEGDLAQIAKLYSNIIDVPNGSVYDLEMADFIVAMFFSSIGTVEDFKLLKEVECPYCGHNYIEKIDPEEITFEEAKYQGKFPIKFYDKEIKPLTVKDFINIFETDITKFDSEIITLLENIPEEERRVIYQYASLLSGDFKENIKEIFFMDLNQIKKLKKIDEEIAIGVNDITKVCPKCHKEYIIPIKLEFIKAYPNF